LGVPLPPPLLTQCSEATTSSADRQDAIKAASSLYACFDRPSYLPVVQVASGFVVRW
jgi:hypothetical protein